MRKRSGTCAHCGKRVAWLRPRGLCFPCYSDTGVRGLYPAWQPVGWEEDEPVVGVIPPGQVPDEPTYHLPGTEGKLQVMEARAAAGLALHHPDDAKTPHGAAAAGLPAPGRPQTYRGEVA